MFTKIDSSVKNICFARGERISHYQFACKDTQFFSFTQINAKKNMILCHTTYKNFAPRLRHVTAFAVQRYNNFAIYEKFFLLLFVLFKK